MKKILITGGSGFIGRNLKDQLSKKYQVITPSSKTLNLLNPNQTSRFLKKHRFNTIIHCATHNSTVVSDKNLNLVFKNNLKMFFSLYHCSKLFKRMFYFGSGAEYDKTRAIVKAKETDFDQRIPIDDYGFSKYIMAKASSNSAKIYNLRLFGCFGKYEDWRIRFISQNICRAILNLDIVINRNVYFDYLYINDLGKIMKKFVEAKKIPHQTYNICTGRNISLTRLANLIKKTSNKNLKIKIKNPGLNKQYTANNSRLIKFIPGLKFTPHQKAINQLYRWYNNHQGIINEKWL